MRSTHTLADFQIQYNLCFFVADPARKDASAKSAPNVTTKKENESTHATKDRKGPKMPPQSTAPHAVKPILVGSGTQPGSQDDVVLGAQNVPL